MTVSTSTRKENFAGAQATLTFSFRALTSTPSDIKCLAKLTATGVETELVYNEGYTVSINSDGVGGVVTVSPTYSAAYTHTVYRATTLLQESDYDDYNAFPADTVETSLDKLVMSQQEQEEDIERSLRYPISSSGASTELPAPEASSFLRWNVTADAIENAAIPDPGSLVKANAEQAAAGTDDTTFMTPSKTSIAIQTFSPPLTKATQSVAEAASNNTDYMTPLQVKNEVQKAGAVSIPIANIPTITSAKMPAGTVIQIVNVMSGAVATGTTQMFYDDTIPQNTEGVEYMTLAITPTNASNKLRIDVICNLASTITDRQLVVGLFQDTTANGLAAVSETSPAAASQSIPIHLTHYMTAGTTSATIFKVRCGGAGSGTTSFNGAAGSRIFGGVMASSITITEVQA